MEANILNWAAAGPSVSASATVTSIFGIFIVLFIIGIIAVVGVAQGLICAKVKNPLTGLIIPAISFFFGTIIPLIVSTFIGAPRMMLFMQIPTLIYLIIFAAVRFYMHSKKEPKVSKKEIEKMNIQDL
ncbi:MAG: hypothetical protein IJW87_04190 [Clostridia bacterium]|nr:hypothetical protein [Clostridia bacterium]